MTEAERIQAFVQAMQELEAKYGVTVKSTVAVKQYGNMMQVEPGQIQVTLIEGWKEPPETNSA